jgi:protein-S-isoprenylcysteine O-methyltransferase Ste14
MLRKEMPRRGQWLFVHRTFVPFLLLPVLALVMAEDRVATYLSRYVSLDFPDRWQYVWEGTCLAIAMIGVLVRTMAVGYAAKNTSGRNTREGQRADALNTTGLYSLVRNPLYLGNLIIMLGVLLTVRSWELTAIFFLAFLLYYERIIAAEEAFLEDKFGDEYREWASATPCLRPRLGGWRSPPRRFSWRQAIRGEYQSVFGVVVAMFAIRLARDYLDGRPFEVDRVYGIAFAAAATVYVIVRTIKKRSKLLEV